MARVGLVAFITLVIWLFLGGLLGVAGILLTSHIPFVGLGVLLAVVGGLAHIVLIVSNQKPEWWKVSLMLAVVLSLFSIVSGTLAGNRFPLTFLLFLFSYYFLFGALIYIFIQKYIVISMLKNNEV